MARLQLRVSRHQRQDGPVGLLHLAAIAMAGEHLQVELLRADGQGSLHTGNTRSPTQAAVHVLFQELQQALLLHWRRCGQRFTAETLLQLSGDELQLPVKIALRASQAGQQGMASVQQSSLQGLQGALVLAANRLLIPGFEAGAELIDQHRPGSAARLLRQQLPHHRRQAGESKDVKGVRLRRQLGCPLHGQQQPFGWMGDSLRGELLLQGADQGRLPALMGG